MDLLSPELSTGIGRIIIHSNEAIIHLWLLFRLDHGDKRSVPDLCLISNSLQHSHANTHTQTHTFRIGQTAFDIDYCYSLMFSIILYMWNFLILTRIQVDTLGHTPARRHSDLIELPPLLPPRWFPQVNCAHSVCTRTTWTSLKYRSGITRHIWNFWYCSWLTQRALWSVDLL